jgi:hypothetical protein
VSAPALRLRKERKSAAGCELPGFLGDDVIVGRRPVAGELREIFLVVEELELERRILVEQRFDAGPGAEQAANPDP